MNVCDNLGDHLVGNVYVKFKREEDAEKVRTKDCVYIIAYRKGQTKAHMKRKLQEMNLVSMLYDKSSWVLLICPPFTHQINISYSVS